MTELVSGFELPGPVLVLGLIVGMTYGLLAVGLVLVFRSNKIINFAHGEIGAFSAALLGVAVIRWDVAYWLAFPLALVLSAGLGALVEVGVVRRLRRAPKLMGVIATLGVSQILLLFGLIVNNQARSASLFPQPRGMPTFDVGALRVTQAHSAMLILSPVVVVALTWFLRRTRLGIQMRGSAANPERARLSGVFATRMSTLSWAIAGALSALTAILLFPTRGFATAAAFGPALLVRALFAAVAARMTSLPVALGAGVMLGLVEQVLLWNYPSGGFVEMAIFVLILLALLVQRRQATREEERGSWTGVAAWPPLPEGFTRIWSIRNLGRIFGAVLVLAALVIPVIVSNSTSAVLVSIMSFALVGLSIGIVTGLSGQLSLGQFALAGVGATASYYVAAITGNFVLAFVVAGLAAAAVSTVIGIPALRIRGLMLAVTTLSFALMAQTWLLQQPWMLDVGVEPDRPELGGLTVQTSKSYYFLVLGFVVLAVWMTRNLRRSGFGRSLVALRDNEQGARAFTVPATVRKLQAFAVAGFLAGLGGAVYGHGLSRIASDTFPVGASIDVVAMTVVGGIAILAGPLLGALYIIGVPAFLPLDSAGLAATALGWLILILYFPGGLAQLVEPLRDRVVDWLARRAGVDPRAIRDDDTGSDGGLAERRNQIDLGKVAAQRDRADGRTHRTYSELATDYLSAKPMLSPAASRLTSSRVLLEVHELHKRFGGVTAVDDVSIRVRAGETVGIIGPNGAGKTTLFELISGFIRPERGRIIFAGQDVSRLSPEARGRSGLIRSFQDAFLFPTMTVLDTLRLAQERAQPTRLIRSVIGIPETDKDRRARELVHLMGLDAYRHKQIRELSTGTRRIAELACLVALDPVVLLLDEPSSGIAQRETEELGAVLNQVKSHLHTTLMVIEHDMPLIMGLSDRIIAMDTGRVLTEGSPAEVRDDPRVIEAYLGGDPRAIQRSGSAVTTEATGDEEPMRCRQTTQAGSRCSRRAVAEGLCHQHRDLVDVRR